MSTDPFRLVGTIVDGRYRVEAFAGQGGHGVVYRAHHLTFESAIALKVLKLAMHLTNDERKAKIAEFRREGKLLFELSGLHASIVRAFESGVITSYDGSLAPYLALEWLDGSPLDREIKYRRDNGVAPLQLGELLVLLDPVARALTLAHARGIVHRDLKPGNLFAAVRAGRRTIKVLDFGIAKILDDSLTTTATLANTGSARSSFTPGYGAPEQWLRRLGATGPWTDVHAWALVCGELLAGKAPFAGDEPADLMAACLDAAARPTPRNLGVDVSDEVEQIFAKALKVNPRDRFHDIGEFWSSLCRAARWAPAAANDEVELRSLASAKEAHGGPSGMEEPVSVARAGARTVTGTTVQGLLRRAGTERGRIWWAAVSGAGLGVAVIAVASLQRSPTSRPGGNVNGGTKASASVVATEPASAPFATITTSTSAITLPPHQNDRVEAPRPGPAAVPDRQPNRDRAFSAPSVSAGAPRGVPAPATPIVHVPGNLAEVRSDNQNAAPSASRSSPTVSRRKASGALEQLMENEELVHRR